MQLKVIASGSTGNCYILEGRTTALILECGVPPERLMRSTSCPISRIAGCLVSHEHGDHAAYVGRYANLGLDVYASAGTLQALGRQYDPDMHALLPMVSYRVGEFTVRPFPLHHDAAEPFGYMVEHEDMGRLLFVTDTRQVDYTFRTYSLNHILVEANYSGEILDGHILCGDIDGHRARRIEATHLSLQAAVELVKANQTPALLNVVLLHLSSGNSDARRFQEEMRSALLVDAEVEVAAPGLTINLDKEYFLTI